MTLEAQLNTSSLSGLRLLTTKPCCVLHVPAVRLCCDSSCQSVSLMFLFQHSRCSFTWHVTTWSINWKDSTRAFFFSPFGKKENNKKPTVLFSAMWNENLLCRFCEQTVYFVTVMKWLSIFSFKLKYTHRLANVQILNLFYIQILRWNLELISAVIETIEAGKNMHVFNNAFLCEPWG